MTGPFSAAVVGLLVLSLCLLVLIGVRTWQLSGDTGKRWMLTLVGVAGWWTLMMGVNLFVSNIELTQWIHTFELAAAVLLPLVWLGFTLAYTGRSELVETPIFSILMIPPAASIGILLAEQMFGLGLYRADVWLVELAGVWMVGMDYGWWGLIQVTYSLLLVAIGIVVLLESGLDASEPHHTQALLLVVVVLLPTATESLFLAGALPLDGVNFVPVSFAGAGLLLLVAIERYQLLQTLPIPTRIAHEAVLSSLETPLVVLNDNHTVAHMNPEARRLFQSDDGDMHAKDFPGVREVTSDGLLVDELIELTVPDGRREYLLRTTPLRVASDQWYGTILLYQDMTAVRSRERRLNVLNRVLRHDIRNEMTVVLGQAQSIQDGSISSEEALSTIIKTANSVIETSETARDMERLVTIAPTLEPDGHIEDVLEDIHHRLITTYPGTSFEMSIDVPTSTIVPVGFAEVVWHLVDNAVAHNPSSDRVVRVEIEPADQGWFACRVRDNGPGIPPEEVAIFESGEITALDHASGLGLWLVHWVVAEFGGSVDVDTGDAGTEVTVTIPEASTPETVE